MIEDIEQLGETSSLSADLVVVGAGPAGVVAALEVARAGFEVLLVESGRVGFDHRTQRLSDAELADPDRHAEMGMAVRRQLGGASTIWGGRCVPYDQVDFDHRAFVPDARWPVSYDELLPYFDRASQWCVAGRAVFDLAGMPHLPRTLVPGLTNDQVVRVTDLERWSLPTDFWLTYESELRARKNLRVITGLTCKRIVVSRDGATQLDCSTIDKRSITLLAKRYVLACGGLESTRLLLNSQAPASHAIGDHSGHLGRWYMGHIEGVVADLQFTTDPRQTVFGYERDIDGTYVRRRFSFTREFQLEHQLPNVAAWLANPPLADPSHRSGELSFAYLALRSPVGRLFAPDAQRLSLIGKHVPGAPYPSADAGPVRSHLGNIVRDPISTARFIFGFGPKRFLSKGRRAPGFFAFSRSNTYPLQYHGEHLPCRESRVTLAAAKDELDVPRLKIDIRYSEADIEAVVRAHDYWDAFLRRRECGRLQYRMADVADGVRRNLGGGFHQVGTTRMSEDPRNGVVDRNLAIHTLPNVHVASSSSFVSSGQANSTFMIVVFSVRLGDFLRRVLRE